MRPLVVFPAMSIEDHEALRDWWQQNGGLLSRCFRNGLFENLVTHNLGLGRMAQLTHNGLGDYLFDYVDLPATEARDLIKAAKVSPLSRFVLTAASLRPAVCGCMHSGAYYARFGRP